MDTIVLIAAIIAVVFSVIAVIVGPFQIGKERQPLGASGYLSWLIQAAVGIIMAGRIFGWW